MVTRAMLLLAATMLGTGADLPAAPMAPAGNWVVDEVPSACRATRAFGASGEITLRIIAKPITDTYLVSVTLKRPIAVSYNDPISVALEPSGQKLEGRALGFSPFAGRPMLVGTFVDAAPFADSAVSAISFSTKSERLAYLVVNHLPALVAALKNCGNALLARFGVDMAAQAAVATPPKPISNSESLFSYNDYPKEALRAGAQGMVAGRFRVAPDGSVTDCVIVSSSGNAALDQGTCAIWSSRAKFKSATGIDGRPIASAQVFSTRWALPPR